MALRIPYANDAKQYDFVYLRHLAETLLNSEGVANYQTDMVVTNAATGLKVDIAAGAAWVKGDSGTPAMGLSQGLFSVVNDAAISNAVTLPAADPTNPRLDQIVLRVQDSADLGTGADVATFDYVQGTASAGATLLNRTGAAALGNDRLRLADVLVPAAATNLVAANVRDRRIPANGIATRYIATAEAATVGSMTELATPDTVELYVPPSPAVVEIDYQALWKATGANVGGAQLYITDVATMTGNIAKEFQTTGAPASLATVLSNTGTGYGILMSGDRNLVVQTNTGADLTTVNTGMVEGGSSSGAPMQLRIFGLPGGTNYTFAIRYQAGASSTITVKERRLIARVIGQGRSQ